MKQKHWKVSVFDKTSETIKNDTFYTTDTEAYLTFELIDEDFTPDSATVTVYNIYGKATINASSEIVDGIVLYEMPEGAIGHPGGWRTQVVFTKDDEDYTTKIINFDVGGHLLDNKKPAIVDIENWNSFIAHAEELIGDWEQLEEIRQANEQQRELAESARQNEFETNESTRQSEFETNETSRQTSELVRDEAENNRQSTFETNESERLNKFETNEDERKSTFEISESARQANELIREETEGNRQSIFEENEVGRQSEFSENEVVRESAESERMSNEEERELNETERITKDSERDSKIEVVEGVVEDVSSKVDSKVSKVMLLSPKYDLVYDSCVRDVNTSLDAYSVPMESGHYFENVEDRDSDATLTYEPDGVLLARSASRRDFSPVLVKDFNVDFPYFDVRANDIYIPIDRRYWFVKYEDKDNWVAVMINAYDQQLTVVTTVEGVRTNIAVESTGGVTGERQASSATIYSLKAEIIEVHKLFAEAGRALRVFKNKQWVFTVPIPTNAVGFPNRVGFTVDSRTEILNFKAGRSR